MSKVLAVFGATGQQGGSVVAHVLNDAALSQKYKIRAITRDVNSDKIKTLKGKVEVVQGDVFDRASLETALAGVHTVYIMTTPSFAPNAVEVEFNSGKTIADVAVEKGVQYLIFSTLPSPSQISAGRYTKVTPFDAKAKIEQYIRGLKVKSAFTSLGYFMENFGSQPFLAPKPAADGTFVLTRPNNPKTPLPFIDAVGDTGKFVGAILADPDKYAGKMLCCATTQYTWEDIVATMSKATGKTVVYDKVPPEDFKKSLPFPGDLADIFVQGFAYQEEYGYFGLNSQKEVAWAAENARGKLSTLEEFWKKNPLQLA